MTKRLFAVCSLSLLFWCLPVQTISAPLTPVDFQYCTDVKGAFKAETLYQLHITDEIIQKTAPGYEDLRFFDTASKEIPSIVIGNNPPFETVETYPLEITGYENDVSFVAVILKMPQKHRPISVLNLEIQGGDFKKHIAVSGSSDGKTWSPLVEDSIYDFMSQVNLRKTKVEFPSTDSRYFRVKLTDFTPQAGGAKPSIRLKYDGLDFSVEGVKKKELRIRSVQGSTQTPAEKKPVYDKKTFTNLSPSLDKEGNTVIILKADLPVDQLILEVSNPYYYRTVYLYGSSTGKDDSYRLITSQMLYRFPLSVEKHEEKNNIEQRALKNTFYKVVIVNKNNPALEIKGITLAWVQQNLYFIALQNGGQHTLCFGNQKLKRPEYDIVQFINQNTLSKHAFERVEISPLRSSSGRPASEWFVGMEKTILTIVVVVLVIGMGGWLFLLLKKAGEKK
jgi:hypothetical protein